MKQHDLRSAASVIQRMKDTLRVQSDRELAKYLGVSPRAVSAWRTRDAVPYKECVEVAVKTVTALDWLLLGSNISSEEKQFFPRVDYELLRLVIEAVENNYVQNFGDDSLHMSRDKALQICGCYRWWANHLEQVINTGKFTRTEAMALIESLASERDKLGLSNVERSESSPI